MQRSDRARGEKRTSSICSSFKDQLIVRAESLGALSLNSPRTLRLKAFWAAKPKLLNAEDSQRKPTMVELFEQLRKKLGVFEPFAFFVFF
jgi:hypothetical protein